MCATRRWLKPPISRATIFSRLFPVVPCEAISVLRNSIATRLLNEGAKLYTKLLLRDYSALAFTMREIALWMAYLKSKIRQRYCYYITDGKVIYLVTPLWVVYSYLTENEGD